MDLRQDNPYGSLGFITNFANGDQSLDRFTLKPRQEIVDRVHTIVDNETLLDISFEYYKTCRYWWVLQDVNKLECGLILETGKTLIVPDIALIKSILL